MSLSPSKNQSMKLKDYISKSGQRKNDFVFYGTAGAIFLVIFTLGCIYDACSRPASQQPPKTHAVPPKHQLYTTALPNQDMERHPDNQQPTANPDKDIETYNDEPDYYLDDPEDIITYPDEIYDFLDD